jgi:hypothetical protein
VSERENIASTPPRVLNPDDMRGATRGNDRDRNLLSHQREPSVGRKHLGFNSTGCGRWRRCTARSSMMRGLRPRQASSERRSSVLDAATGQAASQRCGSDSSMRLAGCAGRHRGLARSAAPSGSGSQPPRPACRHAIFPRTAGRCARARSRRIWLSTQLLSIGRSSSSTNRFRAAQRLRLSSIARTVAGRRGSSVAAASSTGAAHWPPAVNAVVEPRALLCLQVDDLTLNLIQLE